MDLLLDVANLLLRPLAGGSRRGTRLFGRFCLRRRGLRGRGTWGAADQPNAERADLDLVGAKVYSQDKHGRDVGTLVGRDPVGVLATADTAEAIAMPADGPSFGMAPAGTWMCIA